MKPIIDYAKKNKIDYSENSNIKALTSIRIGGIVRLIILIKKTNQLIDLKTIIKKNNYPYVIIGKGSNIIFSNNYSDCIVLINEISNAIKVENNSIKISSGTTITNLLLWCIRNNISGSEFLAGIPGSIGGALAVNAGAFDQSMADILVKAEILTEQNTIETVNGKYFHFKARESIFKYGRQIILNVYLNYHLEDKNKIKEKIATNIKYRKENHPSYNLYTAGCFFKNPKVNNKIISAGKIIDEAGLKGFNDKYLEISNIHANFIINKNKAEFKNILELEHKIIQKVLMKSGIKLEREVIYISPKGEKY